MSRALDSKTATKTFDPNSSVQDMKSVDVVFRYLDASPEKRDQAASFLTQKALIQAFPEKYRR
jgi:hypothetical protein